MILKSDGDRAMKQSKLSCDTRGSGKVSSPERLGAKSVGSFGQGPTIKRSNDCRGVLNTPNNYSSHFKREDLKMRKICVKME
ncbi:hypothetical protein TNCT_70961 [Trichonephila clavata]|uniref:Uncharacterized protein n=1 Tax=Trichonephila clavata TaxID=2740835 RepID=A0A8X6L2J0_TRICU|nr:hypothetical protein TNCT_70961 [Trichonephila clavata]